MSVLSTGGIMYSRICIFGRPCSGKSTFADKIHKKTGLPLYHLDEILYISEGVERESKEFVSILQNIVNQDSWIIDGNMLKTLEMRYARADLCIYFNYSRMRCLYRFFKRALFGPHKYGGLMRIRWRLIKYIWTFEYAPKNKKYLQQLGELGQRYPAVNFIEVAGNADLTHIYNLF